MGLVGPEETLTSSPQLQIDDSHSFLIETPSSVGGIV